MLLRMVTLALGVPSHLASHKHSQCVCCAGLPARSLAHGSLIGSGGLSRSTQCIELHKMAEAKAAEAGLSGSQRQACGW